MPQSSKGGQKVPSKKSSPRSPIVYYRLSAPLSRGNASCAIVIRVPNESPRSDFPSRTNLNRSELGAPYHHLLMDQSKECLGIPVSAHPASTVARYNEWIGSAGPHKSLRSFYWLEIVDPWGLPLLLGLLLWFKRIETSCQWMKVRRTNLTTSHTRPNCRYHADWSHSRTLVHVLKSEELVCFQHFGVVFLILSSHILSQACLSPSQQLTFALALRE